jgi:D-alanyl-D-alanine carboxypeptidase
LISEVHFDVVQDPNWPAKSVVIFDTATGKVIESFAVDEKGRPVLKTP